MFLYITERKCKSKAEWRQQDGQATSMNKLRLMNTVCGNAAFTWTQHDNAILQTGQFDWCSKAVSGHCHTLKNALLHESDRLLTVWLKQLIGVFA